MQLLGLANSDIWTNRTKVEMAIEFTDDGTEMELSQPILYVLAFSSGNKGEGIIHVLMVHNTEVHGFVE